MKSACRATSAHSILLVSSLEEGSPVSALDKRDMGIQIDGQE
jgi:hypothetical protein